MTDPVIQWPGGRRAVVSLTYDDGNPSHTKVVAPLLEKNGIRGTFYVPIMSDVRIHPQSWVEMAKKGHEIGNHTLFHPCRSEPGAIMDWLDPVYNLVGYTPRRWMDEVDAANFTLYLLDGQTERTFGNTCYHTAIGTGESLVRLEPMMESRFVAARGEKINAPVNLEKINYYNLGTAGLDFRSFSEIEEELNNLLESGGWIIYTGHGVGKGSHKLFSELEEHTKLLDYLGANQENFWTAPLIEVVRYLKSNLELS